MPAWSAPIAMGFDKSKFKFILKNKAVKLSKEITIVTGPQRVYHFYNDGKLFKFKIDFSRLCC
jgi:hypothetical protein